MRVWSAFYPMLLCVAFAHAQQKDGPKPAAQNPSPMVENTRAHERIPTQKFPGIEFTISDVLPKPVEIFIPQRQQKFRRFDLLLHFHGAGFLVQYAATRYKGSVVAAVANLGSGSSVYGNAFDDSTKFSTLLTAIMDSLHQKLAPQITVRQVILSGFSAGYGAIRKIISTQQNFSRVDAILLLDGIHASYIPERQVLAEGGKMDSTGLEAFLQFAHAAGKKNSSKRFLITHSEIFPGTFVSATEATDFILQKLDIRRQPILKWGPRGMQQLSRARRHHFAVLGFAGNTAPDHVDHLHGLFYFLNTLKKL
ncbi:hypothetical protein L0337_44910 [candidate division KSB1 bacterium]|nr:hypothetical protein [candidate division KSB1 bacterium]